MNPFGKKSIARSAEFQRIASLPVREPLDGVALAKEMTEALAERDGCQGKGDAHGLCTVCRCPVALRPVQALALYELMREHGLAGIMGVGTGKTLVFLFAPVVLNSERALGILPASLIDKTERERAWYAGHWRVDRTMQLISYEMLGREQSANLLDTKIPDDIFTDESHRLKNPRAACTRRVSRYLHEHPETRFVSMSGTYLGKSLRDMAHLLRWSLGAENAPVPATEGELEEWADALDERVNPLQRVRPGALLELGTKDEAETTDQVTIARRAFHRRLVSTPGIICSLNDEQVNCSLYIRGRTYGVNEVTDQNFETLRSRWETPDGWALSEAVEVWRHARELALGLHYVWDPRPPDEWLQKRRAWAKFVRDCLSSSRTLDSEKQVASACDRGELDDGDYRAWEAVRPTFQINQKAVWHDDSALEICARWLEKEKGICWVDHAFFGHELAKRTGLSYYGRDGLDAKGAKILDAKGPIIASIAANGTGKNLQAWSKNLITSCPTGASVWEQLVGRTHRQGQMADAVEVDVLIGCIENAEAWERATAEAKMAFDMLGAPQKILMGDVDGLPGNVERLSGARWKKVSRESNESY